MRSETNKKLIQWMLIIIIMVATVAFIARTYYVAGARHACEKGDGRLNEFFECELKEKEQGIVLVPSSAWQNPTYYEG